MLYLKRKKGLKCAISERRGGVLAGIVIIFNGNDYEVLEVWGYKGDMDHNSFALYVIALCQVANFFRNVARDLSACRKGSYDLWANGPRNAPERNPVSPVKPVK